MKETKQWVVFTQDWNQFVNKSLQDKGDKQTESKREEDENHAKSDKTLEIWSLLKYNSTD